MIPLPVILTEFLLAFGAALFLANLVAFVRLRREDNWPPTRPVGAQPLPADGGRRSAARARREADAVPSRARILAGLAVGLVVALWALATLVTKYAL